MTLTKWKHKLRSGNGERPALIPRRLRQEISSLAERLRRRAMSLHDRPAVAAGIDYGKIDWIPWLDVFENERSFVVRVELPGIDPQKMDVHLAGRRLVIAGSKEEAREDRRAHYWRAERRFGTFRRTVFLPESVDPQRVTAEYADGVLVVRCEKKGIAVPRRVPVQLAHAA